LEATTRDLQEANEKLKQVDRLKDDFVSTVTHELRTPLTAIRALTEILHTNPSLGEAERTEFLGTIQRETSRLTRLVNQVLDLQRLEAEPVDLNTVVPFDAVVHDAVTAITPSVEQKGATLTVDGPAGPAPVPGDRDRLMQVVLNLLSNAETFCRQEVRVTLRADERVTLSVADDGPGIATDQQEAIFEKFRQIDSGATPGGGSGLGLAIARDIVRAHHGSLDVDSSPGEGAIFVVRLPLHKGGASVCASVSEATDGNARENPRPRSDSAPSSTPSRTGTS
jgi:signal transduction histidine kinase